MSEQVKKKTVKPWQAMLMLILGIAIIFIGLKMGINNRIILLFDGVLMCVLSCCFGIRYDDLQADMKATISSMLVAILILIAVGVLVGNVCLKNLIARPRPCWLDSSVRLLIADPTDYSFPSGHTLSSVIGATILTKTDRRFGYAAIPLAALIAFSRLYLYAHFPSDVLAAAVLGVMIGELAFYADRRWTERRGT